MTVTYLHTVLTRMKHLAILPLHLHLARINNPTYIYAILTDGDNISKASTYTETHIDTTASSKDMPSVISSPTNPTKAVVLTNNQKDNESGIKEVEYGYSKTKDGEYELWRYNEKYDKWVHINFIGEEVNRTEQNVVDTLSKQFIARNIQDKDYKFLYKW